jgi:hypothetical protein
MHPLVSKLKTTNKTKALIAVFAFCIVGISIAFYRDHMLLTKENGDLTFKLSSANYALKSAAIETTSAKAQNADLTARLEVIGNAAIRVLKVEDDLDHLELSDDQHNRELIGWLQDNARFTIDDGSLAVANQKIQDWNTYMKESDAEYSTIKANLADAAQQTTASMNQINDIELGLAK